MKYNKNIPFHEGSSKKLYVPFEYHLLNSEPYRILHRSYPTAHSIYVGFRKRVIKVKSRYAGKRGKRSPYVAVNDHKLIYPYREMMNDTGAKSRATITRNIDLLISLGFIDIMSSGGLARGHYSIYAISDRWEKFGKPDFVQRTRRKGTRHNDTLKQWQEKRRQTAQSRILKDVSIPVPPRNRTYTLFPDGSIRRIIKRRKFLL